MGVTLPRLRSRGSIEGKKKGLTKKTVRRFRGFAAAAPLKGYSRAGRVSGRWASAASQPRLH